MERTTVGQLDPLIRKQQYEKSTNETPPVGLLPFEAWTDFLRSCGESSEIVHPNGSQLKNGPACCCTSTFAFTTVILPESSEIINPHTHAPRSPIPRP